MNTTNCGFSPADDPSESDMTLRVASIFVILVGSLGGALFPILVRRTKRLSQRMPERVFDTAKYFGSGVIIATSLIHLLDPAVQALGSPCLSPAWREYPYALGICLTSIFIIFIVELLAFRWGTARLARLDLAHDTHGHGLTVHTAHGPETDAIREPHGPRPNSADLESGSSINRGNSADETIETESPSYKTETFLSAHTNLEKGEHEHLSHGLGDHLAAQIVGITILEFGVVLHSVLIGLTLAVNTEFKVLFVVIALHQTFEGLGVGSRLAFVKIPPEYNHVPVIAAVIFGFTTPIGIAVGLGLRNTYSPGGSTAMIVSGVLDAFSSGILLYTGLVELMAHEFLFNSEMLKSSNSKLAYALGCMILGASVMAVLGKWS